MIEIAMDVAIGLAFVVLLGLLGLVAMALVDRYGKDEDEHRQLLGEWVTVRCPHCSTLLTNVPALAGQVRCQECGHTFEVSHA